MSLLVDAIRSHAAEFDSVVYPTDIYFFLLKRVGEATTPAALGDALMHLLAWKDGKVRHDHNGRYTATANRRYSVARTKPNTLEERHDAVLRSEGFYKWAETVRSAKHFDASAIEVLQERFPLWKSIVLPVFVLHCLRPPIYPIVDRYVIAAFNLLRVSDTARYKPTDITVEAYEAYHRWWLQLLKEAEIPQLSAELNELKEIDSGIWALGKAIFRQPKEIDSPNMDSSGPALSGRRKSSSTQSGPIASAADPAHGTDSRVFKARAVKLWIDGKTQAEAIKMAAEELGITLKNSYVAYPGSHFDRWRKQGFWSKKR